MILNEKTKYFFKNDNNLNYISEDDLYDLIELAQHEELYMINYEREIRPIVTGEMPINDCFLQVYITSINNLKLQLTPTPYGLHYISLASNNHFFRGENKVYDRSVPSLNRSIEYLTREDTELVRLLNNMRIYQFEKFIQQFDIVKAFDNNFAGFNVKIVNIKAIAQHYGFKTHLLDITNDALSALFFAVCYYDQEKGCYLPITQEMIDYQGYEKGVIYHAPKHVFNLNGCMFRKFDINKKYLIDDEIFNGDIYQIGFQPFYRCHYQKGYVMPMRIDSLLQENNKFEKLVFNQLAEFSKKIYEMMECGKLIYPFEGINEIDIIIGKIKKSTKFSKSEFEHVYKKECDKTIFPSDEECLKALKDRQGIDVIDDTIIYNVDIDIVDNINNYYREHEKNLEDILV